MQLRSRSPAPFARSTLSILLAVVASTGCGGSTSEPPKTPTLGTPLRVVVVTSPKTTGGPGTAAGDFVVRVEDAEGLGVRGVRVVFASRTDLPYFTFSPADATTDSTGVARTAVTFGSVAGANRVTAKAAGVADPAIVDVTVTPGPLNWMVINPTSIRLYAAGDEAIFQAFAVDGFLNPIPDAPILFAVSDPTLLSVTAPTSPGGSAKVRALKGGGSATITVSVANLSSTIAVSVFERPRSACAGIALPQDLAAGVVATVADSVFCIGPTPQGAEYALLVYNGSTNGATSIGSTVTAYNVLPDLLAVREPGGFGPSLSRAATLRRRANAPKLDLRFHERLLTQSRSLRRLFAPARAARARVGGATGRIAIPRPSYSRNGTAVAAPAVDDLVSLNVATAACSDADVRTFRVEAVGAKAIVLADTANPSGGFTRLDYQRFATRFDTLVYPLDRDAFGEPTDIDGNGHVAILFTRAVNELTPSGSDAFVGGFFHPRDLFPRVESPTVGVCETSNEGEMFYMLVPDPTGTVNGNAFTRGMVDTLTTGVLAHEFQHLINASRRMYVNTAAQDFEETWLNEGLSHVAEELLFFRESGYTPRSGLATQSIIDTWAHWSAWVADDASNFVRFYLYMLDPANHSPLDTGDELETRGATWAFLRYAVDQSFPSDAGVWQRFGNATTTGVATLTFGLQRDPKPLLRDFSLANFRGVHPSWNFADVFDQVFVDGYRLPFGRLQEATAVPVAARGSSMSYYKFAVPPDAQTLLKFGSSQAPPSSDLTFMVVRTRWSP
jgi:hypothetical protein